jgi:palmitoyltransferase ZDHHC9/14/18
MASSLNTSNNESSEPDSPSFHNHPPSGPPSIISSRMTDIASEADSHIPSTTYPQSTQHNRQSINSFSASRPGTGSSRTPWNASPPSRRGLPPPTNKRGSLTGMSTVSGGAAAERRPPSSASRAHVPSLTSHAFFRPMSSQRLQAQRGGNSRPPTSQPRQDVEKEARDNAASPDIGLGRDDDELTEKARSDRATRPGFSAADGDNERQAPPSRGTEFSEPEQYLRTTANTSPTGHHATGSLSSSVRPLQHNQNVQGLSVNIDRSYRNPLPTPAKSPRSFRGSFLLPSKGENREAGGSSMDRSAAGREKLSSNASSPGMPPPQHPLHGEKKENLGRVHEYWAGNTRFWFGGRWQNARDRPVNIATGFLVVLPAVLFFVFSAPWLWHNISPAIPIVFAYIFYICFSSFVHASVSDPGVCLLCLLYLSNIPFSKERY